MVGEYASIDSSLSRARQAFEAKDLPNSIEHYTQALNSPPLDEALLAECLERLSFLHRKRGDLQTAAGYLFKLLNMGEEQLGASHPSVVKWRETLAEIYSEVGQYDQLGFAMQGANVGVREKEKQSVLQTVLGEVLKDDAVLDRFRTGLGESTPLGEEHTDPFKTPEAEAPANIVSRMRPIDPARTTQTINPVVRTLAQAQSRFNAADYVDNILGVVIVTLAIFFTAEFIITAAAPAFVKDVTFDDPKSYYSCDQIKHFSYLSTKKARFSVNDKQFDLSYYVYGNGLGDWLSSLPSSLLRKEYWMQDRGTYLTDEQNTLYIDANNADMVVIDHMKQVGEACLHFYEEKGVYPTSLANIEGVNFEYLNPYTARRDTSLLQAKTMSATAERPAELTIAKLIAQMKAGGRYPDEPALYPGCVDAHVLTVRDPTGVKTILVVHGCGADGKLLSAGEGTDKTYVITQIDGKAVDFSEGANPLGRTCFGLFTTFQFRPASLCILKEANNPAFSLYLLKYRGILGFIMLGCIFFTLALPLSETKVIKKFANGMGLAYFGLALMCILNTLFP